MELYRRAHEGEYPDGTCSLGVCYEAGRGVPQDAVKAAQLYRQAAQWGHARAQYFRGGCYENGRGVDRDRKKAKELYQEAAKRGYKKAEEALQRLKRRGFWPGKKG